MGGGAVLGWEVLLHVVVHTFFHITLGFVLKRGERIMKQLREFWTSSLGKLAHFVKDMTIPVLATAAATIRRPRRNGGAFLRGTVPSDRYYPKYLSGHVWSNDFHNDVNCTAGISRIYNTHEPPNPHPHLQIRQ